MVLNDAAEHSDQTGGGKVESASIQFSRRQPQNWFTRSSFRRLDKKSNAKQSLTCDGGKSGSPIIFFKN